MAVEKLMPKLFGGRVLITSRFANFSAAIKMLPVDVLDIGDATSFLIERTLGSRTETPEDAALAQELPKNSAASRSGSNRRAPISRRSASALPAISNSGKKTAPKCCTGSIEISWPMTTMSASLLPGLRRWSN